MLKKISFLILSVAIVVVGAIAFNKLGYWNISVRIFSLSSDANAQGRFGGGERRGEFAGRGDRPQMENERAMFDQGENIQGPGNPDRNLPDSLHQRFEGRERGQGEAGSFRGGMRNGEGRGGEFGHGKKVNFKNIPWFLAVFAAFTVVAIYSDRGMTYFFRNKVK